MSRKSSGKNASQGLHAVSPEKLFDGLKKASLSEGNSDIASIANNLGVHQSIIIESESPYRIKKLSELFVEKLSSCIPGLETERYHGSTLSNDKAISSLIFSCDSDSLFSTAKVIIVKEAESLKVAQVGRLLPLLPLKTKTLLVFQCKKIPAGENWKKLLSLSSLCKLAPFTASDLNKWIQQEAKRRGASGVSQEGRNYLVHDVACPVEVLDHIIEKACLLSDEGAEISLQTLRHVSEASLQKDSFDLFSAIAKKDTLAAGIILHSILQNGTHPLQILGFFNKAIKSIIINKSTSSKHDPVYFADLHNSWFTKKLSPEKFSRERLERALKTLAELDSDIKGKNFGENNCLQSKLVFI
jgi:DNA polymerase III delta subunit